MTNNNALFEQLTRKFWFVLVHAETHYATGYEFWTIPKDEFDSLKDARKEATEMAEDLLGEICDDDEMYSDNWYDFAWTLEEVEEAATLGGNPHFYVRTSEQDRAAVRELIASL